MLGALVIPTPCQVVSDPVRPERARLLLSAYQGTFLFCINFLRTLFFTGLEYVDRRSTRDYCNSHFLPELFAA